MTRVRRAPSVAKEIVAHAISLSVLLAAFYTMGALLHFFDRNMVLFDGLPLAVRSQTLGATATVSIATAFLLQSLASVLSRR